MSEYPHQMSGGMRQRAVGAIALSGGPDLIIADEPTTNLDVTIQAQYLNMLKDLQRRTGVALLFITHNLGIVAKMCDRVAVMYAGKIVEQGPVREIYLRPRHPYTKALISSIPKIGNKDPLYAIPGQPPDLAVLPPGCAFHPRCPQVFGRCSEEEPQRLRAWVPSTGRAAGWSTARARRDPVRTVKRRRWRGRRLGVGPVAGPVAGAHGGVPNARSAWPDEVLPGRRYVPGHAPEGLGQGRRRDRLHHRRRARRWAWSASPAAARRPRRSCCSCWSARPVARSCSTART